jgi:phosphoribosyl 1,2-cyclic phosphodiesterase
MSDSDAKLVFWGVRGSTPTVDRETWRYGGNTPCVEFTSPNGTRFILDCGTGLRMLGNHWAQSLGVSPIEAWVLVTHYHWDHVQGIPFFHPFFEPQNRFHFYSFQSECLGPDSLKQVLASQLSGPYFPVPVSMMSATRDFHEISGGDRFEVDGTKVITQWLNHPQGCLGYRLETSAGVVVYATDNEPGDPKLDANLRELAAGADVYIHDAQCTPEQLASSRRGWGHSSWLEGVKVARDAGVKNLILFHHDPDSCDKTVDGFLQAARQEFPNSWAATEGMSIRLRHKKTTISMRDTRVSQRRPVNFPAIISGQAEDGTEFEEQVTLKDISLHGAFVALQNRPRLQSEVKLCIETANNGQPNSMMSMRGTVVHRDSGPHGEQNGIGIVFMQERPTRRIRD